MKQNRLKHMIFTARIALVSIPLLFLLSGCGTEETISKEKAEQMVISKYQESKEKEVVILKTRETRASYWITWKYMDTNSGGTSKLSKVTQQNKVETIEKFED